MSNSLEQAVAVLLSNVWLGGHENPDSKSVSSFMPPADTNIMNAMEDLRAAYFQHHANTGWRDISTAPRDGTRILVWRAHEPGKEHLQVGVDKWKGGCWYRSRTMMQPTHWQPLPPPPGEEVSE